MKIKASFNVESVADTVDSIGATTYGNISVENLCNDENTPYEVEANDGSLFMSFWCDEADVVTPTSATFTNAISGQYTKDVKPHWVGVENLKFVGGRPKPRPSK